MLSPGLLGSVCGNGRAARPPASGPAPCAAPWAVAGPFPAGVYSSRPFHYLASVRVSSLSGLRPPRLVLFFSFQRFVF